MSIAWTHCSLTLGSGGGPGGLSRGLGSGVKFDLSESLFPYL